MNRKMKISIRIKVLMASLLPLVVAIVMISGFAISELRSGLKNEALNGLEDLAYSAMGTYDALDDGNFYVDGNHLMKGEYDVTANEAVIDSLTKYSDSDVTIFYGDTRYASSLIDVESGERIVGTKADAVVIQATIKEGKVYRTSDIVVNNASYYAVYVPYVNVRGVVVGMIFAGKPSVDVNKSIDSAVLTFVIIAVVFLIIAAFCSFFVVNRVCTVINRTSGLLEKIAAGDLTVEIDKKLLRRSDEVGIMANSLSALIQQLNGVLGKMHRSSEILTGSGVELKTFAADTAKATQEISDAVDDISHGSVAQAGDVENANARMAEMGQYISDITEKVNLLHDYSSEMEESKNEADQIVRELASSGTKTSDAVKRIARQVDLTDESVTQIEEAVALITSIADETNLLSLNASIEAARAGEAGRGFAVVASQIQKLAEESNKSAASIGKVIQTLSMESRNTVEAMDYMRSIIDEQQEKLLITENKFMELGNDITSSNEQINVIRNESESCNKARGAVTTVICDLSAISEENAAATEETAAAMQELNSTMTVLADKADQLGELAIQFEEELKYFKVDNTRM